MAGSGSDWQSYDMTLRSKHQSRRSQVHHELSRELLLKEGAENLLKAKIDSKARKKAEMELSFYNCKVEMLREELNELNSTVLVYQTVRNATTRIPMLPIAMKETEPAKFNKVIMSMLIKHYHVSPDDFSQPLEEINRMREMLQKPSRDKAGIELLFEYCNQLYFIDKRFYPSNKKPVAEVYFQWFDLWSGTASAQRSIAFEKANVMFNISALYSQMAVEQDRTTLHGLEEATKLFERAAGMLQLMSRAFVNSPSLDISNESVNVLYLLMMAQAQECNWEQIMIKEQEGDVELAINITKETCQVAASYREVVEALDSTKVLKEKIASFWTAMVKLKHKHFQALTCFYAGIAHVEFLDDDLSPDEIKDQHRLLMELQNASKSNISSRHDQLHLGYLYFNAAVQLHEESQKVADSSKEVKKLAAVQKILEMDRKNALSKVIELKHLVEKPIDLSLLPRVKGERVLGRPLAPEKPDFNKMGVIDFFRRLGPSLIFNANVVLGPPHDVAITQSDEGFGFVIRGNRPVKVRSVDIGSPAETAGLLRGDVITAVNGEVSKFMTHDEVVGAIRFRGEHVVLSVMSPENVEEVLQASPTLSRSNSIIIHTVSNVPLASDSPETGRRALSYVSDSTSSSGLGRVTEEFENMPCANDNESRSVDNENSGEDSQIDLLKVATREMELKVINESHIQQGSDKIVQASKLINAATELQRLEEPDMSNADIVAVQEDVSNKEGNQEDRQDAGQGGKEGGKNVDNQENTDEDNDEYAVAKPVKLDVRVQLAETVVADDDDVMIDN